MEVITKEILEILRQLSEPLPKEAIQRTKKEDTRKSYNTDGYGYQFCVNRFNEVLGNMWGYTYKIIRESTGNFKSGTPYFDITVETNIWILSPDNTRSMIGGHISSVYSDAIKGAFTNSFKKTASMWGVGNQAYCGTLDDDASYEDEPGGKRKPKVENNIPEYRKEPKQEPLTNTVTEPAPTPTETKTYLTFDGLIQKMATSKNKFELNARCKKYKPDYNELDQEHQKFVIIERDKRILWLTKGEGIYEDEATRGIDKDIGNEGGK